MCTCDNIIPQTREAYDNMIQLPPPAWSSKSSIGVDACVASEVWELWQLGIQTTGACCGHNKVPAYIGVQPKYIPKMKELGYEVKHNRCRPKDEDSFKPKST